MTLEVLGAFLVSLGNVASREAANMPPAQISNSCPLPLFTNPCASSKRSKNLDMEILLAGSGSTAS